MDREVRKIRQAKIAALKQQEKMILKQQQEAEMRQRVVIENTKYWLERVIPIWNLARGSNLVRQLCYKGIPPNIRGKIWPLLIENDLNVMLTIFCLFLKCYRIVLMMLLVCADDVDY